VIVELVRAIGTAQQLELEVVQQLSDAMRELAASHAALSEASATLEGRVRALEDRGAVAARDGHPMTRDATQGLDGQALQAQRHASDLIERAAALRDRAAELMRQSEDGLPVTGRAGSTGGPGESSADQPSA